MTAEKENEMPDTKPRKRQASQAPPGVLESLGPELLEVIRDLGADSIRQHAAKAFEPLPDSGPLRCEADGTVVLTLNDKVLRFRVPAFGDYEQLSTMSTTNVAETFAWWRKAAELLADGELPPDGDLPTWLANQTYPQQTCNSWMLRPTQAPGT